MMQSTDNCTCGQGTVVLSLVVRLSENKYASGAFFFGSMVYVFVGIAIVADIFMDSVEKITSQTKIVKRFNKNNNRFELVSDRVWNQTVANLSLMAFGSSAPEILLATIEIIKNKFEADKLGPGTIVGASMFNTFVITAFCIVVPPNRQNKQIRQIKVFWTSTFFNLAAYVWLYLILSVITPGNVTIAEAVITLLMFPVMVVCGYLAEKGFFLQTDSIYQEFDEATIINRRMSFAVLVEMAQTIDQNLNESECKILAEMCQNRHHRDDTQDNNAIELTNVDTVLDEKMNKVYKQMQQNLAEQAYNLKQTVSIGDNVSETPREGSFGSKCRDAIRREWAEQIRNAFQLPSDGTDRTGSCLSFLSHFITFFWKTTFSLIPPTSILGGWLTFLCSVVMIALLTALMGDLATSFGCSLQWDMHSTSITVVAIGTSLPDLFASRVAAKRDNFADNAIGNINGSNAFNVFLGLGFPWLCATVYHQLNGSQFLVTDLEDLAFSVQIFILFSLFHLVLLTVRRKLSQFGRGELGGPRKYAYFSSVVLVVLWLVYIVLCITR